MSVTLTHHVSTLRGPMYAAARLDLLETVKSAQVHNNIYYFLQKPLFKA